MFNITKFYFLPLLLILMGSTAISILLLDYFLISPTGGCCAGEITFASQLCLSSVLPSKARQLSKLEREAFSVPTELKEILVGLLLGDLHAEKRSTNARLKFVQSTIHVEYISHLYELFKNYGSAMPKTVNRLPNLSTGKIYSQIVFNTYSLPCFNEFHGLFYLDGLKIVPLTIKELLTPLSLAYWLSDDGTF